MRIFRDKVLIYEKIMSVKVYQYGSPLNSTVSGEAENQIRLQARFWNQLVETDREFAERYREITNNADEKIACLNQQVQEKLEEIGSLRDEIKGRRKRTKSGKVDDSDVRKKVAALLLEKKPLIEELNTYRANVRIKLKPRLSELEAERRARVKELRQAFANNGLYWGNYNALLKSYQTARSRAIKSGGKIRFRHYDGTGRWTCQIQGGMSVDEAFPAQKIFSRSTQFRRTPGVTLPRAKGKDFAAPRQECVSPRIKNQTPYGLKYPLRCTGRYRARQRYSVSPSIRENLEIKSGGFSM